jgi:hypothetical protein
MVHEVRSPASPRGISRAFLAIGIFLTVAIFIGICVFYPRMRALRHDERANFWYATTGVDIGVTKGHLPFPSYCIFDEGRFIYGEQWRFFSYPDMDYESISESEAEVDFPRVQAELEKRAARNDPDDCVAAGYERWHGIVSWNGGIRGLMEAINTAYFEHAARQTPPFVPTLRVEFRQGLLHVARADRLYWVCFLFEMLYLSAVVWFSLWHFIRRAGAGRKILRVALLPLILIIPNWLGYCNTASPAFPRGGVIYPYICGLSPSWPENYEWEYRFLGALPPFFSVITQGQAVTFADYPTLRVMIPWQNGPVRIALYSALLTSLSGAVYLVGIMARTRHRRKGGLCPICSYDLRAHRPGQRCPECGTLIAPLSPSTSASPSPPRG